MGRILAIDFGTKRTGLAWTDELQISVNPIDAMTPDEVMTFLETNIDQIALIVLGEPSDTRGMPADSAISIRNFRNRLRNAFPAVDVVLVDESYTSAEALDYMIRWGYKKKDRQKKENIDKFAAAIILQRYLDG